MSKYFKSIYYRVLTFKKEKKKNKTSVACCHLYISMTQDQKLITSEILLLKEMWIQVFKRKIKMAISQFACPSSVIYPCTFFTEKYPFLWAQNPNLARIQAEKRTRRSLTERHGADKTIMSQSCWQPEWVRQEIIKFSFAIANSLVYFCDRSAGWQKLNEAQILIYLIYIPCTTAWFGFFTDLTSCFSGTLLWSTYATSEILLKDPCDFRNTVDVP